ncbi:hypothetical protein CO610_02105 [Lysobacteraceae bacterium NML95-0200]|nr:hypothetical protein CO610_02105 [Xanthomonadaceae bacterium NML95-0200]
MPIHISDAHKSWLNQTFWDWQNSRFRPLLRLQNHAEEGGGEPRWLLFCDYLVKAWMDGQSGDKLQQALYGTASQLWGEEPAKLKSLVEEWFLNAPGEIINRAIAVASWIGQQHGLPALFPEQLPELQLAEQAALGAYLRGERVSRGQVRMPVMLLNSLVPADEQGRRAQLRLTPVAVPAKAHGRLFRAPAALLLSLRAEGDHSFEAGLGKVERLLARCLKTPQSQDDGWALLWSLHPEPMTLDRGDVNRPHEWFMHAVTGASATGAFVLAGLHALQQQLDVGLPGMRLVRQQLREINLSSVAISAQLSGDDPPETNPLSWRWQRISGLDAKLGSFVRDRALLADSQSQVSMVLVASEQAYAADGDALKPVPVETIAEALEVAHRQANPALPDAAEALRRFLLAQDLPDAGQTRTPLAPAELIDPLRAETLRGDRLQCEVEPGSSNAIAWYLLRCYARWAGGEHLLWGEPARLAEDFFPVHLKVESDEKFDDEPDELEFEEEPDELEFEEECVNKSEDEIEEILIARTEAIQARTEAIQARIERKKKRIEKKIGRFLRFVRQNPRSLHELLDIELMLQQPPVWVLAASPAAGKTTMLAEFQLFHAYKALRQYASDGHFGVVPLWVPARELDADVLAGQGLGGAIDHWLEYNWPELGKLSSLLKCQYARVQILLDGINELRCAPEQRSVLLNNWLLTHFPASHTHCPPLLTVRTLELIRPPGAKVAHLQPWDEELRQHYVQQRLQASPQYLQRMLAELEADARAAGGAPEKMLYASPGMLSLACTLMSQGLLGKANGQQPITRARLLSTLVWSRLQAEIGRLHPDAGLLGWEEQQRLQNLPQSLQEGDWWPPAQPGVLWAALARQAKQMQFDLEAAIELPERDWWPGEHAAWQRNALSQASAQLGLVQRRRGRDEHGGRFCNWLRFSHQLLMEFFATYELTPDTLPEDIAVPGMRPVEGDFAEWEKADRKPAEDGKPVRWEGHYSLPEAAISPHEETIKLAVQLHGHPERWVQRLLEAGNPPLAARVALENWAAFGEPLYPQEDVLGPWRPERSPENGGHGTHPVLNKLRQCLHERMYNREVHISQRIEAGNLLGQLGGSPLFEIAGKALVLKSRYWARVPLPGKDVVQQTQADDEAFFMVSGFLLTNAQYICYLTCCFFDDLDSSGHNGYVLDKSLIINFSSRKGFLGLNPVRGLSAHMGDVYARWELSQRQMAIIGQERELVFSRGIGKLRLPTLNEWNLAACNFSGGNNWAFAHTQGKPAGSYTGFSDVSPWDFNCNRILDGCSPVGVFVESNAGHGDSALRDMAGNVHEVTVTPWLWSGGAGVDGAKLCFMSCGGYWGCSFSFCLRNGFDGRIFNYSMERGGSGVRLLADFGRSPEFQSAPSWGG